MNELHLDKQERSSISIAISRHGKRLNWSEGRQDMVTRLLEGQSQSSPQNRFNRVSCNQQSIHQHRSKSQLLNQFHSATSGTSGISGTFASSHSWKNGTPVLTIDEFRNMVNQRESFESDKSSGSKSSGNTSDKGNKSNKSNGSKSSGNTSYSELSNCTPLFENFEEGCPMTLTSASPIPSQKIPLLHKIKEGRNKARELYKKLKVFVLSPFSSRAF